MSSMCLLSDSSWTPTNHSARIIHPIVLTMLFGFVLFLNLLILFIFYFFLFFTGPLVVRD